MWWYNSPYGFYAANIRSPRKLAETQVSITQRIGRLSWSVQKQRTEQCRTQILRCSVTIPTADFLRSRGPGGHDPGLRTFLQA